MRREEDQADLSLMSIVYNANIVITFQKLQKDYKSIYYVIIMLYAKNQAVVLFL